ncbi:MAG TPA: substrate-binding domain-containing protein [Bacteroidales bacterium]|nr:substrate-binding domain-containing protein [Bacteroidales bacterium]
MAPSKFLIALFCLLVLISCKTKRSDDSGENREMAGQVSVNGNISISGAYALSPLMKLWAEDFGKLHPDVTIEVKETGTGRGIKDLLDKNCLLAMISRPLTDSDRQAGIWAVPVAKDGVAVIINRQNPYLHRILQQGLSPDELQKIFTYDTPGSWSDYLDTTGHDNISVYSRADESGAADLLAAFIYKHAADLKGTRVNGDEAMIKSIGSNKLAIGFCNFSFAFDVYTGDQAGNILPVPLDLDFNNKIDRRERTISKLKEAHRSVWLGLYPAGLCRELTIGSSGKPADPAVKEFIRYILSEGQENVEKMGLCKLNNVYLRYSLESLK